jgi:hypothetical protein
MGGGNGNRTAHSAGWRRVDNHRRQIGRRGQELRWLRPGHENDRTAQPLRGPDWPEAKRLAVELGIKLARSETDRSSRAKDRDQRHARLARASHSLARSSGIKGPAS